MSRRHIAARQPSLTVVVGWDNPLQTFFAQVTRIQADDDDRDPIVIWIGGGGREARIPEDLIEPLAPYADLPRAIIEALRSDRAACLDRGPTALQRDLIARTERKP